LSLKEQQSIRNKVETNLINEGYTGLELEYFIELAMDSKINDVEV
jgi:hypothetical protein